MITGTLKKWYRQKIGEEQIFWGRIYDDTKGRFRDGTHIHTSKVTRVEDAGRYLIVSTLNSKYLCYKDEDWETAMVLDANSISTSDFYRALETIKQRTMGQTHETSSQETRLDRGRVDEGNTSKGDLLPLQSSTQHDL